MNQENISVVMGPQFSSSMLTGKHGHLSLGNMSDTLWIVSFTNNCACLA